MSRKKKIIIIISSIVIMILTILFCGWMLITSNTVSLISYYMVEESCMNNADYENSIFADKVSQKDYYEMNTFRQDEKNYDKIEILVFSHTYPQIKFIGLNCIEATYIHHTEYTILGQRKLTIAPIKLIWKYIDGEWVITDLFRDP